MKLICPNCDAQYELADDIIPDTGRDVQCSNCGTTWFQTLDDDGTEDEPPVEARAEVQPRVADVPRNVEPVAPAQPLSAEMPQEMPARPRRAVNQAVMDVLREEAEREKAVRAAEGYGAAKDPAEPAPTVEIEESVEGSSTFDAGEPLAPILAPKRPGPEPELEPRGNRLPDIEEINSTLRASTDPDRVAHETHAETVVVAHQSRQRAFRMSFGCVLIAAALALFCYTQAPRISGWMPFMEGPLERYVAAVNKGRIWLDRKVGSVGASASDEG